MKITFAMPTCRKEPHLDWFVDGLEREAQDTGFDLEFAEIVVVDALLWIDEKVRREQIQQAVRGRIPLKHVPPKPTPWCGPHKITQKSYAAHGSARNTVFCWATGDHVISVDDNSVLERGWLMPHLQAAHERKLFAGIYHKRRNVRVDRGTLLGWDIWEPGTEMGVDGRATYGTSYVGGGWFFTGNCGIPLELALRLNGFEEWLDAIGCEDCDFGARADLAGSRTWLGCECVAVQAQDLKQGGGDLSRTDFLPAANDVAYIRASPLTEEIGRRCFGRKGIRALGNPYPLADLRNAALSGRELPIITAFQPGHWAKELEL
jgi:hypothetical protein